MNVSEVARRSRLSAKTIRYYESIGLISAAMRRDNGYREYSEGDLEELCFLQQARATGFSLDECRQLLALYRDTSRHSAHVKSMVMEKIERVETQLRELSAMRDTLVDMAERCAGNQGPHCAIIDRLAETPSARAGTARAREAI